MFFLWESVPLIVFPYALQHTHHASNVRLPTRGGFIKSQSFLHITNLTFHLVVQSRIRLPGSAVLKVSYSYKKTKKNKHRILLQTRFLFQYKKLATLSLQIFSPYKSSGNWHVKYKSNCTENAGQISIEPTGIISNLAPQYVSKEQTVDTIRMAYLSHPLFLSCFVLDLNQLNITERDPAAFTHQKKKSKQAE